MFFSMIAAGLGLGSSIGAAIATIAVGTEAAVTTGAAIGSLTAL